MRAEGTKTNIKLYKDNTIIKVMYYTLHLNSKIIYRICAGVKMVNVWNIEILTLLS